MCVAWTGKHDLCKISGEFWSKVDTCMISIQYSVQQSKTFVFFCGVCNFAVQENWHFRTEPNRTRAMTVPFPSLILDAAQFLSALSARNCHYCLTLFAFDQPSSTVYVRFPASPGSTGATLPCKNNVFYPDQQCGYDKRTRASSTFARKILSCCF